MTCQCTQCRKQTGSLFYIAHSVPASCFQILGSQEDLKQYKASPEAVRTFCGKCGSFLLWSLEGSDHVSFAVGTVDALYLFGEGAEDRDDVPKHGFGEILANGGGGHEFCRNEIKGVTDDIPLLGQKRGKRFDGDLRDG